MAYTSRTVRTARSNVSNVLQWHEDLGLTEHHISPADGLTVYVHSYSTDRALTARPAGLGLEPLETANVPEDRSQARQDAVRRAYR